MSDVATHYGTSYFDFQRPVGEFGGWANETKFTAYIRPEHDVLDFGCGGGFLLKRLNCRSRYGIEINPNARLVAESNGISVVEQIDLIANDSVDVIISNHCLEHVPNPLAALIELRPKLRRGGLAVFVVPCESISTRYRPQDMDQHLYTWSPLNLGNLFAAAGFEVLECRRYAHKWPPVYRHIARLGRFCFDLAACVWDRIDGRIFQVRVVARNPHY